MKYRLYDYYEGKEKLGEYNTLEEVSKTCRNRAQDTDDECILELFEKQEDNLYHRIKNWHYNEYTINIERR